MPDDSSRLSPPADWAALALDTAGCGALVWDRAQGLLWLSDFAATLLHAAPGVSAADRPFPPGALADGDADALTAAAEEALASGERRRLHLSPPGGGRLEWSARAAGPVGRALLICTVCERSEEDDETRQLRGLAAELDHRVKNVLASVQSMASQSARRTASLDVFLKTFTGRLQAMAAAHALLTATRWRGADIADIAAAELGGLAQGQAHWGGPDVALNPRATHALTLALHELSANALKYGALTAEGGRIDVAWRRLEDGGFELTWKESGGPVTAPATHKGFGWTLLERVTSRELGGSVSFDLRPQGLRVVLTGERAALAAPMPNPAPAPATPEPASRTGEPAGASRGEADSNIAGMRILIVEDAVLLALELEAGLVESGARVVGIAADLDEALRMLDLDFDAAVLDANLAGRSVLPVATALAARGQPFIIATGYGGAGAAPEGVFAPVVRKPYNVRQIAAALSEARKSAGRRA